MKAVKLTSAALVGLALLASCNGKKKAASCDTDCACDNSCACNQSPCACPTGAADLTVANQDTIEFLANGERVFVTLNKDASALALLDQNKQKKADGKLSSDSNADSDELSYQLSDGRTAMLNRKEGKLSLQKGNETQDYVLVSPIEQVYVSGKDTILAIYRPQVSVTLLTPDSALTLKQGPEAGAKCATYTDGKTTWETKDNKASFKKDGKTSQFTTDGKSQLPKINRK